jgi:phage FluMu protein Com
MTTEKPAVSVMNVRIRCTGKRKDGSLCDQLLAVMDVEQFVGVVRIKCPRCGTVAEFK